MKILPDSSVWIEYLRRGLDGRAAALDELLGSRRVLACAPVVAELIGGSPAHAREDLRGSLDALPWAPIGRETWLRVGTINAALRAAGTTVGLTDVTIAAAAAGDGAAVWSFDADFDRIADVMGDLKLASFG